MVQRAPPTILGLQLPVPYGFFLPFPVGVPRLELGTSALSGLRSNQLSYTPNLLFIHKLSDFLSRLYDVRSHAVLAHRAAIAEELFINHTLLWVNGPFWLGTQADIYYCRVRTG